jgi:hypothetical protein
MRAEKRQSDKEERKERVLTQGRSSVTRSIAGAVTLEGAVVSAIESKEAVEAARKASARTVFNRLRIRVAPARSFVGGEREAML